MIRVYFAKLFATTLTTSLTVEYIKIAKANSSKKKTYEIKYFLIENTLHIIIKIFVFDVYKLNP